MRFGLFCFVILFLGTELVQWLGHHAWLSDLPLPVTVLAGIGLAIASNLPNQASSTETIATPQPPISKAVSDPEPLTPASQDAFVPPPTPQTVRASHQSLADHESVSFKIRKPFQS